MKTASAQGLNVESVEILRTPLFIPIIIFLTIKRFDTFVCFDPRCLLSKVKTAP